jgi:hypothetical protein
MTVDACAPRPLQPWQESVGLSEREILDRWGEPTSRASDAWRYEQRLGPGAHSFKTVVVLHFAAGTVERVTTEEKPVGCIIVERTDAP